MPFYKDRKLRKGKKGALLEELTKSNELRESRLMTR